MTNSLNQKKAKDPMIIFQPFDEKRIRIRGFDRNKLEPFFEEALSRMNHNGADLKQVSNNLITIAAVALASLDCRKKEAFQIRITLSEKLISISLTPSPYVYHDISRLNLPLRIFEQLPFILGDETKENVEAVWKNENIILSKCDESGLLVIMFFPFLSKKRARCDMLQSYLLTKDHASTKQISEDFGIHQRLANLAVQKLLDEKVIGRIGHKNSPQAEYRLLSQDTAAPKTASIKEEETFAWDHFVDEDGEIKERFLRYGDVYISYFRALVLDLKESMIAHEKEHKSLVWRALWVWKTALCVEIGFKTILHHLGEDEARGHDLSHLWSAIERHHVSNLLALKTGMSCQEISDVVAETKNVFVDWRYFYEDKRHVLPPLPRVGRLIDGIESWLNENIVV